MELKELMAAFAAKLGIEGVEATDGTCSLEIDGVPLRIAETDDAGALVASAIIGPPPVEKADAFMELLLDTNMDLMGPLSAAFGRLHDTGDLVLMWRVPTQTLDLDAFCAGMETFMNSVDHWRQALESFGSAAEEAAEGAAEEAASYNALSPSSAGFIQV